MQTGPPFRPQQHHHHDSPRYRATLLHDDDVTGVAFAGDRVITASWGGAADEPVLGGGGAGRRERGPTCSSVKEGRSDPSTWTLAWTLRLTEITSTIRYDCLRSLF